MQSVAYCTSDDSLFLKKMEPLIKCKLCKQHKHDNIWNNYVSFWGYVFVFKLQIFLPKKWIFIQNVYKERPLFDKKTYNYRLITKK